MNSTKLPFNPIDRTTLGGCAPSLQSCALLGSVLVFVVVLILGGAGATAYFLSRPKVAATPVVKITAPANGSEIDLQSPLLVVANAATAEGVDRLELWQDGQQINGVGLTNEQGLPELTASMQWRPPAPGRFTLEIRAYGRANEVSALALVTVNVIDKPAPVEAAAGSTVLTTKTSLIVRDGPGESFAAIHTLPTGVNVMALEQSADQKWWRVALSSTGDSGWIAADTESVSVASSDILAIESVSPVATATATPEPTATETPTSTPEPTATPAPTNAPAPPQAGSGPGGQPGGPGGQLPQEAITACSSLSEGDSCTASGPMGDMTGTCVTLDSQLACMPEGGPPGRP